MAALITEIDLASALRHLRKDPHLAPLIKRYPKPVFSRATSHGTPRDPFYALVESIVFQQLSGKAADTILGRLLSSFPRKHPTPKAMLALPEEELRAAGLSHAKAAYLRDLAEKFLDGTINAKGLAEWDDETVRQHLIAVKGIGRWSADMFLMFYLHRPDVLPTGDLAIRKGFQVLFGMRTPPSPARMEALARPWQPYRTVACRYLWDQFDMTLPGNAAAKK
ncbi:MAG TPA: DNA-3-methyladenine glycosylase [Candidatus Paceibacterota bacterium]|nr:DNA-3-methyladenine glycosylase [Candidatus Paceibacterota bacterium]